MTTRKYPTREELRELFDYGEEKWMTAHKTMIGGLIRLPAVDRLGRPNTRDAGQYAGTYRKSDGRVQVQVKGKLYELNRLTWIWHNGDIEEGFVVDHVNRDTSDGRIGNLRLATNSENNCNRRKSDRASSKYKGVYWNAARKKWNAQIKINGEVTHLGSYSSEEEAAKARNDATEKMHGEFGVLNVVS